MSYNIVYTRKTPDYEKIATFFDCHFCGYRSNL